MVFLMQWIKSKNLLREEKWHIKINLGIIIREAGFISLQIFINVYKAQCFQYLAGFEVS